MEVSTVSSLDWGAVSISTTLLASLLAESGRRSVSPDAVITVSSSLLVDTLWSASFDLSDVHVSITGSESEISTVSSSLIASSSRSDDLDELVLTVVPCSGSFSATLLLLVCILIASAPTSGTVPSITPAELTLSTESDCEGDIAVTSLLSFFIFEIASTVISLPRTEEADVLTSLDDRTLSWLFTSFSPTFSLIDWVFSVCSLLEDGSSGMLTAPNGSKYRLGSSGCCWEAGWAGTTEESLRGLLLASVLLVMVLLTVALFGCSETVDDLEPMILKTTDMVTHAFKNCIRSCSKVLQQIYQLHMNHKLLPLFL